MKHYGYQESHNIFTDNLCTYERSVRDDYYDTYDYEESVMTMERYLQKHSCSLDSILDRY